MPVRFFMEMISSLLDTQVEAPSLQVLSVLLADDRWAVPGDFPDDFPLPSG